jgi:predicted RNA-binding protein
LIEAIKLVNYWLCITNEDNWKVAKERKIWGITKRALGRNRKLSESVKPGDLLIFYVKPKRIAGLFASTSNIFESYERLFSSVGFDADETFPYRLKLKPLIIPEKPIEFTPIVPKMTFIKKKKMWQSSIYGRAMIKIPKNDYKIIREEFKKALKGHTTFTESP